MGSGLGEIYGPGYFMCCICFYGFPNEDAYTDEDGQKWDNCKACAPLAWRPADE